MFGRDRNEPRWMVINQTQALVHQQMLERLAERFGQCVLVTGSPFQTRSAALRVVAAPPYSRRGMAERVASWLRFTGFAARQLLGARGRPFVLAVSNPPFNALLAWMARHLRGFRYGLLVWDIYPDHVVAMGWLSAGHPAVAAWRELNRRALSAAEIVITLSQGMAAALPGPALVIPNWADAEAVRPIPKRTNPFAVAHGLTDRLVVLYAGNLGATHGLESLVRTAARLADLRHLVVLLVGEGLGREPAEALARQLAPGNVRFLPSQPWEDLPALLAAGDIAVVSQAPGTEHLSLPSKLYTAMAAGSAILALTEPTGDLARTVLEYDIGRVCRRDDVESIVGVLRTLASDGAELTRLQTNARTAAEAHFSADAVFSQLARALGPHLAPSHGEHGS